MYCRHCRLFAAEWPAAAPGSVTVMRLCLGRAWVSYYPSESFSLFSYTKIVAAGESLGGPFLFLFLWHVDALLAKNYLMAAQSPKPSLEGVADRRGVFRVAWIALIT